jgi:hypothetical protein
MSTNLSPLVLPWDLQSATPPLPPRRPILNDWNGAAKIDDAAYPPDAQTMPNAPELNLGARVHVAAGAMIANLIASITGGVAPVLAGFMSPSTLVTSTTLTTTRNAIGDVSITWPANTFPTPQVAPSVSTNAGVWCDADVVAITNGVRVRTYNGAGAATDLSFTVTVY